MECEIQAEGRGGKEPKPTVCVCYGREGGGARYAKHCRYVNSTLDLGYLGDELSKCGLAPPATIGGQFDRMGQPAPAALFLQVFNILK